MARFKRRTLHAFATFPPPYFKNQPPTGWFFYARNPTAGGVCGVLPVSWNPPNPLIFEAKGPKYPLCSLVACLLETGLPRYKSMGYLSRVRRMNWSPVGSFVEPIILFRSMSERMANSKGLQVRAWCLHGHTTEC